MKTPIAAMALAGSLAALTVSAQVAPPGGLRSPTTPSGAMPTPTTGPKPAPGALQPASPTVPTDPQGVTSNNVLPEPVQPEQMQAPTIALPTDPIEPYLLTKAAGPFMVLAKSFRGPEADRYALALALELQRDYGLPAYILRSKEFPGHSNIRNIPPTAPPVADRGRMGDPERVRTYDEAVVLVGNEKTLKGQEILWHKVKKIKPRCLDGMPKLWLHREGLAKALRTTNPYIPAQNLYPGKPDMLVQEMNQGPHSIYNCPGRYTLEVADFRGRSTFNVEGAQAMGDGVLKKSPLATAHEDAEKLAAALAKAEEIRSLGQPVYVYHDLTSSKVMVGAFQSPHDPAAVQVRDALLKQAVTMMDTTARKRGIDKMIAPANGLTDLQPIKPQQTAQAR